MATIGYSFTELVKKVLGIEGRINQVEVEAKQLDVAGDVGRTAASLGSTLVAPPSNAVGFIWTASSGSGGGRASIRVRLRDGSDVEVGFSQYTDGNAMLDTAYSPLFKDCQGVYRHGGVSANIRWVYK